MDKSTLQNATLWISAAQKAHAGEHGWYAFRAWNTTEVSPCWVTKAEAELYVKYLDATTTNSWHYERLDTESDFDESKAVDDCALSTEDEALFDSDFFVNMDYAPDFD